MKKAGQPGRSVRPDKSTGPAAGSFMEIARELRQIQEQSPDEFVRAAKRLGVEKRKAYYLVEIDRNLEGLKIDHGRLARIGWTKLQIIAGRLNSRTAESQLSQAERHTAHELARLIEREAEDSEPREHAVLLYLTKSEYDVFRAVVTAHGATISGNGLSGKEQALIAALKKLKQ